MPTEMQIVLDRATLNGGEESRFAVHNAVKGDRVRGIGVLKRVAGVSIGQTSAPAEGGTQPRWEVRRHPCRSPRSTRALYTAQP